MRAAGPISNTLGLRVGLVPDDISPEIPAGLLELEGEAPWHADEVLRLQAFRRRRSCRHGAAGVFPVRCTPRSVAGGVGVANVEPQRSVVAQHPTDLFE